MTTRSFSREDASLNTQRIVGSRSRPYSDIDLTFTRAFNGDVFKKTSAAAVKQSVRNLLTTSYYEKPFNWEFGTDLYSFLFELEDTVTQWDIERRVRDAIETYEPRAVLENVTVNFDPDRYNVSIQVEFRVVNFEELVSVNVSLSRLR